VSNKTLIAVDMDDVLFDFLGEYFVWHNKNFASTYKPSDMVYDKLWEVWGGSKEETLEYIQSFWSETNQLKIKPISGADEVLKKLSSKYHLAIVSARFASTASETQAWIDYYFPNIFDDVILGVSDPMAEKRPQRKSELCLEMGAKTLIDDQLVHALECNALGIDAVLFGNLAHNQSEKLPDGVTRVDDWMAVGELLAR